MKAGALVLCCLVTLALLRVVASACVCANLSNDVRRDRGDLIFIGTALSVHEETTLFSVEKVIKGRADKELLVDTPSSDCQMKFEQGATYLVSVKLGTSEKYTDICYGNELIRGAEKDAGLSSVVRGWVLTYVIMPAMILIVACVGGWLLLSRHNAA